MAKRKRSEHYVNNKEFLYAIVEYKAKVKEALENPEDLIFEGKDPKKVLMNYK